VAKERKISTPDYIFGLSVLIIVVLGGVLAFFWNKLPPELPWYYSLPWGEKQLVQKPVFAWILVGMAGVLVLTRIISRWAGSKDETVSITINTGGLIAAILIAASFVRVISIFISL